MSLIVVRGADNVVRITDKDIIWYPILDDIIKLIETGEVEFKVVIKDISDGEVVNVQKDPIVIIGAIVNNGYSLEKCVPTDALNKEWYLHCKKKGDSNV